MDVRQVVPRDAIPSVDRPTFARSYDGDPGDEVVVVDGDPPRAYPVRYLHYHEIVNDDLGRGPPGLDGGDGARSAGESSDPVAVTWCPLCGSAVVYERTVADPPDAVAPAGGDDLVLTFGVSGKLADDDLVLYDRETESEWKQSSGVCIAGPLADRDLTVRPAALVPYRRFREEDGGVVLRPPGGESEAASDGDDPVPVDYDAEPYERYFGSEGFGLVAHRGEGSREWDRDDLAPKAVVLGVERDGAALGFPRQRVLDAGGAVRATVGEAPVLVLADEDVGIHAFRDPDYEFRSTDDPGGFAADGTVWDAATGRAEDGRRLERLPTRRLFAFAWQDDHGPDSFWTRG